MRSKTVLLIVLILFLLFFLPYNFQGSDDDDDFKSGTNKKQSNKKVSENKETGKQEREKQKDIIIQKVIDEKLKFEDSIKTESIEWKPYGNVNHEKEKDQEFEMKSPRGFIHLNVYWRDEDQNQDSYPIPIISYTLKKWVNKQILMEKFGHQEKEEASTLTIKGKMGLNLQTSSSLFNKNERQKRDFEDSLRDNVINEIEKKRNKIKNDWIDLNEKGRLPLKDYSNSEGSRKVFNEPKRPVFNRIQDPDLAMIQDKVQKERKEKYHSVLWVQSDNRPVENNFKSVMGVHDLATVSYIEANITSGSLPSESPYIIQIRLYDTSFSYRYISNPSFSSGNNNNNDNKNNNWKILEDYSSWTFDTNWYMWGQDNVKHYEGIFERKQIGAIDKGKKFGPPFTIQVNEPNFFITVTEANLVNFSGMSIIKADDKSTFKAQFFSNPEGWSQKGEVVSPWRVTLVCDTLNELVNSDVIESLAPPPSLSSYYEDFSPEDEFDLSLETWIQTGRSLWHWWSTGDPVLNQQKNWIDAAGKLGFEFYLIDDGWQKWTTESTDEWGVLRDLVQYAKNQGVKIWIWVHHQYVYNKQERLEFFKKAKNAGVVGVKIDFMNEESYKMIQWYEDTLEDSAKLKLMVNFHGANKPTGRRRTWPHEMTREGIRGHEYHILRYQRTLPAYHDAALPFTRYIAGPGDYTPTVFNTSELRGFTWPRELAQAIVFTSPIIHYADNYQLYLDNPSRKILQSIPSTWDETKVLEESSIGELAAFARRKGRVWFVGIISGKDTEQELVLDCSQFLIENSYKVSIFSDTDTSTLLSQTVSQDEQLVVNLHKSGGFVAKFTPTI